MMLNILAIAILGYIGQSFFPWWCIAIVPFAVAFGRGISGVKALIAGAGGIGLLWLLVSAYLHFASGGILSVRIAEMLNLPFPLLLILITAIIGGGIGGTAGLAGYFTRQLFFRKTNEIQI